MQANIVQCQYKQTSLASRIDFAASASKDNLRRRHEGGGRFALRGALRNHASTGTC